MHCSPAAGCGGDRHRDGAALGILHLRGDGSHPDQLVEPELVPRQPGLGRGQKGLPRRSDRLVRLLGVLDLGGVDPRPVGQVVGPEQLPHLVARGGDRGIGQGDRVGPHVGDEAGLVQVLGHRHRALRGEAELASGLLLQRRGAERRVRAARVGLGLDGGDRELSAPQRIRQVLGVCLVQPQQRLGTPADQRAGAVEVPALGHPALPDPGEPGREQGRLRLGARVEDGVQVPVGGGAEGDPLALAVNDQAGGDGLHPAG